MGGGSTTASAPAPNNAPEMARAARRKEISENKELDEESRQELLTYMDSSPDDVATISAKYQQALDPENSTTKDRRRRQAAKKSAEDTPGLRKQTGSGSYLAENTSRSYMGRG